MLKTLISAMAIVALMSGTALACSGHGSKGSKATSQAPAPVAKIVVRVA